MTPHVLPAGERAVLLEFEALEEVMGHYAALVAAPHPDIVDMVPGARTILVTARSRQALPAVRQAVLGVRPTPPAPGATTTVDLAVRYDGPDLAQAAGAAGMSAEALVRRHTEETWTVAFCGFAPGFGYLVGSRFSWDVPRRSDPRAAVPSGSVGLAGGFSGVYPRPSPGGWQLIGSTDTVLFALDQDPPALLRPGTRVRFRDVSGRRS